MEQWRNGGMGGMGEFTQPEPRRSPSQSMCGGREQPKRVIVAHPRKFELEVYMERTGVLHRGAGVCNTVIGMPDVGSTAFCDS